jgi:hypothetical protein
MQVFDQRFSLTTVLLLLISGQTPVLARGSQVTHDDPWNSEHVDHLPPEVRNAVLKMCKTPPHAAHYFATYLDDSRVIKLHFEHLHCEERREFCSQNSCLHQEYVSFGGHYRLLKSYYGRNND